MQWEYQVEAIRWGVMQDTLDGWGRDGWEVVSVTDAGHQAWVVAKRKKPRYDD